MTTPRPVDHLFDGRVEAIQMRRCIRCKESVGAIEDALAAREWSITGLCPKCQDAIWASFEEDEA